MEQQHDPFFTAYKAFWALVYNLIIVGAIAVMVCGYNFYKEFWLNKKTILIGETNIYDDGSTDERVEFNKGKRR
jgi:hypothetical protein